MNFIVLMLLKVTELDSLTDNKSDFVRNVVYSSDQHAVCLLQYSLSLQATGSSMRNTLAMIAIPHLPPPQPSPGYRQHRIICMSHTVICYFGLLKSPGSRKLAIRFANGTRQCGNFNGHKNFVFNRNKC